VQVYLEADKVSVFSQHFRRPMRLTRSELCALELGLAMLRVAGSREDRDVVESALQRLRKLITSLPGDEQQDGLHHAELSSGGDLRHLATVRDALRAKRVVNVCYRSGSSDVAQERRVRPYGLVYSSGQWYIVGYCESSS
jgi:predicted DNA-binding transcriptional regulator YafY